MSERELQRLLDDAAADSRLCADLRGVSSDRGLSDFAVTRGYGVTVDDVFALRRRLSAGDLESVVGGSGDHSRVGWLVQVLPYLEGDGATRDLPKLKLDL